MKKKRKSRHGRYPLVTCDRQGHFPDVPGYLVCPHVKDNGQPVDEVIKATDDDLGQILCKDGEHETGDGAALVCAYCAKEKGWLPA